MELWALLYDSECMETPPLSAQAWKAGDDARC